MDHLIDSVYRINRNLHRYRKRKERERERTERQKCAKYTGARDTCENVCGETQQGRDEGERGLRGPHGVVKSIRPGLEPRLPALLTVVRRERHQPRRRPGRCHGGRGRGGRGPRIKYHPRYVPFENVPSLSIPLSLSLCRATLSLGLTFASPTHVRARVHGCHSNFQFSISLTRKSLKVTLLNSQRVAFAMLF